MPMVMLFELVECVAEMALVPDEGPVQEFVAECSWRSVCTHLCVIEFILGIRTPLRTT